VVAPEAVEAADAARNPLAQARPVERIEGYNRVRNGVKDAACAPNETAPRPMVS